MVINRQIVLVGLKVQTKFCFFINVKVKPLIATSWKYEDHGLIHRGYLTSDRKFFSFGDMFRRRLV